ncbi:hypothetical protein DF223_12655 [Mycetocola zhujimingii]|uniref:Uncharacterized protein n=1 Tax=Mycetocola zhujimingii TaxID=2079792 RepID=A0A2U1TC26_9MICO|nr:hypothetical protein DF223_12655 [Mycetocola zhujimingii]
MGVISIAVWMGVALVIVVNDIPLGFRVGTSIAGVTAIAIVVWAWLYARTPNDFLTATSTVRLVTVFFGVIMAYAFLAQLSGRPESALPVEVNGYLTGLLSTLLNVVGVVLIVMTDFVRCFTIPLKSPPWRETRERSESAAGPNPVLAT